MLCSVFAVHGLCTGGTPIESMEAVAVYGQIGGSSSKNLRLVNVGYTFRHGSGLGVTECWVVQVEIGWGYAGWKGQKHESVMHQGDQPRWKGSGGVWTLRPSAFGGCVSQLLLTYIVLTWHANSWGLVLQHIQ